MFAMFRLISTTNIPKIEIFSLFLSAVPFIQTAVKRFFLLAVLLAGALARPTHAQEILLGADFKTYFDNKEFGSNTAAVPVPDLEADTEAGTDFAARLIPRVGIRWEEKNTLVIGADLLQNFGEQGSAFVSEAKPLAYYQFETPRVRAAAGIFTRDLMHDEDYSTAFFTEAHRFIHDRMNGVLAQYNGQRGSYAEFVCDWEGMYSTRSREKFRILFAGRHYLKRSFYYGVNYSMFHFAGKKSADGGKGEEEVVDLQLLNPCVGVRFNAFFDFDIKLGALLSAQRDRGFSHGWETPCMGEFALRMSRWGLTLDQRLYVGDDMHPFFSGHTLDDGTVLTYGRELYPGERFFRTAEKIYSRTALSYRRSFFNETLFVRAEFIAHHDGRALGTQQMLEVGVRLLKPVYDSRKHKR